MILYNIYGYLVEPDEIECTVPAVRNVKAFNGMEDMQFVASNPPELPAYAGYEVLHHHGNMVSMCSKIPMVMKCSLNLTLYNTKCANFHSCFGRSEYCLPYPSGMLHLQYSELRTLRALFYPSKDLSDENLNF